KSTYSRVLQSSHGSSYLQNYGNVLTLQGRLPAFPNVFQQRFSGFNLTDPTELGYRRCIALWPVDPTSHIISTANVPPQQVDWWAESALAHREVKQLKFQGNCRPKSLSFLSSVGSVEKNLLKCCSRVVRQNLN
ncbi:hypothetical protein P885DRAFT_33291, partial [Corynascus similis CBS 632.67]